MKDFDHVLSTRIQKIQSVLSKKAEEYASDNDRYHNFNVAGRIRNESPESALVGMWMKHLVSVLDLVDWIEDAPDKLNDKIIDEKIGDAINYLILLEGMLYKRVKNEKMSDATWWMHKNKRCFPDCPYCQLSKINNISGRETKK